MKKFSNKISISIKNVTKRYVLRHQKPTLIESLFYQFNNEEHVALDDITFSVKKGERLGIIGSNGSGKTTLLKIIAGITKPQNGTVSVQGRVVSLIDLEAGFHPDLTGEENIFLNGLIIGMSRKDIQLNMQKIVEFAGIGKFIDAPLYTYSSGMKLRLGYSIAVHSNPDILLLDEVFRKKARNKMLEFKKENKTLIMVSHWLGELELNCNKFLWLEKGKVVSVGNSKKIIKEYMSVLNYSN